MDSESYLPKRRIVLHGPPKSGKTESLARVPKGSSLYLVDVDRQAGGLVKLWKKLHGNLKALEIAPVVGVRSDEKSERERALIDLRKVLWNPPSGFDFYAIDSYTKVTQILTHAICGKGERHYNQFNNQQLSSAANDYWFQFVDRIEYLSPSAWVITVMHEKWEEMDDGTSDENSKLSKPVMIIPKCGTAAETNIPASCDFVWHVEKGRRIIAGKSRSVSLYRTFGTKTIMASSVGFADTLEETELADLSEILPKLGLPEATKDPQQKEKVKGKGKLWQK